MIHRISKLFIDSIHILFMLYLRLWSCFRVQNLQDFMKTLMELIKDFLSCTVRLNLLKITSYLKVVGITPYEPVAIRWW